MPSPTTLQEFLKQETIVRQYEAEGRTVEALGMASELLAHARNLAQDDPSERTSLAVCLRLLGDINRHEGDFASAQSYYNEVIETSQETEIPPSLLAGVKAALAGLYDYNHREQDSISLYEDAIRLYEADGRPIDAANLANNLAMVHKGLGQHEKAEQNYLKALTIFDKYTGPDHESTAAVYNNLGGLYHTAGYSEQARQMHQKALEIRRRIFGENHPDVAQSYANLAAVAHETGNTNQAIDYYERALRILEQYEESHAEDFVITAENFLDLCEFIGDEKRAVIIRRRLEKQKAY
jgi:tetratricopeptide (TPR) repeat protein